MKYLLTAVLAATLITLPILASSQPVKLPYRSNLYPDSLGAYWRMDRTAKEGDVFAAFEFKSMFGDIIFVTEPTTDSLIAMPFPQEHSREGAFIIEYKFLKNEKLISDRTSREIILNMIPRNDKIDAMKLLVDTRGSVENLKLLADAYEEQKCFANAIYVYYRMIWVYPDKGQKHFEEFYFRNFDTFNYVINSAERR
jgi:hypothetical protein